MRTLSAAPKGGIVHWSSTGPDIDINTLSNILSKDRNSPC